MVGFDPESETAAAIQSRRDEMTALERLEFLEARLGRLATQLHRGTLGAGEMRELKAQYDATEGEIDNLREMLGDES